MVRTSRTSPVLLKGRKKALISDGLHSVRISACSMVRQRRPAFQGILMVATLDATAPRDTGFVQPVDSGHDTDRFAITDEGNPVPDTKRCMTRRLEPQAGCIWVTQTNGCVNFRSLRLHDLR